MDSKIRVPRLRSVLLAMAGLVVVFLWVTHHNAQREIANQRATGLGAVATGWDPIGLWQESSFSTFVSSPHKVSGVVGGVPGGLSGGVIGGRIADRAQFVRAELTSAEHSAPADHKLVRSVGLNLLVRNAADTSAEIERITASFQGEIEKADLHNYGNSREGELVLRVPADRLDEAVKQFSRLAIRVQDQHRETRDITREFMDNDARLRNMKAEEQQYLVLLHRAGNMKDTLAVTEKVSEVRGNIEQLQGELNWWSHQVAMSAVQIHLTEEAQATMVARWRPLFNAKNSAVAMLRGLGDWVDWVVALVINVPVILAWAISVGGLILLGWKVLRWAWFRFFKPRAPALAG